MCPLRWLRTQALLCQLRCGKRKTDPKGRQQKERKTDPKGRQQEERETDPKGGSTKKPTQRAAAQSRKTDPKGGSTGGPTHKGGRKADPQNKGNGRSNRAASFTLHLKRNLLVPSKQDHWSNEQPATPAAAWQRQRRQKITKLRTKMREDLKTKSQITGRA